MKFNDFKTEALVTVENSCRQLFMTNRTRFKIKNEELAVKNYEILTNVTLKLCKEKGFQAMSIRDLSKESGLSLGALYYYFSGKDEIVHFLHEQGHRFIQDILTKKTAGIKNPALKLEMAIRSHIFLSEVAPDWFFFFFMETKNLANDMRTIPVLSEIWVEQFFIDILAEGKKANVFSYDNSSLIGAAIKSLLQDWYLKRWRYMQRGITVEQYADFVISIIESYIKPVKKKK
ncbi:MAG TPA: TetR/AcrR family transcriptional regulator [Spirochaetota bacterium]|nr:TetR/AcrR family transcriptional regulator [Spirochaetota bacterium]